MKVVAKARRCAQCENYRTLFCPLREWDPETMQNCPDYLDPPIVPTPAEIKIEPQTNRPRLLEVGDRLIGYGPGAIGNYKNIIVTIVHVTPKRAYGGRQTLGVYPFTFVRETDNGGGVHTLANECAASIIWRVATPTQVLAFYQSKYANDCLKLIQEVDLKKLTQSDVAQAWQVFSKYVPVNRHPDTAKLHELLEELNADAKAHG